MPTRVQRTRTKGWRKPQGVVDVSRPSRWSNPFRIGDPVLVPGRPGEEPTELVIDRALSMALFRAHVDQRGLVDDIRRELAGRDLMCWCRLDEACHADILLELANG